MKGIFFFRVNKFYFLSNEYKLSQITYFKNHTNITFKKNDYFEFLHLC